MENARHTDGSVLVFRGKNQNGQMVLLRLSNQQTTEKQIKKEDRPQPVVHQKTGTT
jgi:hypothetical protein